MPFSPPLGKFLYLFLGRKLYLTKSWLGTFSAIIHSGPTKHRFGPVVRDDTGANQAVLGQNPEDVQEVTRARICVFPWACER